MGDRASGTAVCTSDNKDMAAGREVSARSQRLMILLEKVPSCEPRFIIFKFNFDYQLKPSTKALIALS
jgi:hypothetical protein